MTEGWHFAGQITAPFAAELILVIIDRDRGRGSVVLAMGIGITVQWITGLFALVILTTLVIAYRAWRDTKRSPFYFMRRAARRRMSTALFVVLGLALTYLILVTYVQQSSQISVSPRYALLQNAKPARVILAKETVAADLDATVVDASRLTRTSQVVAVEDGLPDSALVTVPNELPDAYNAIEPAAPLSAATELGEIAFSSRIGSDYQAIQAQRVFEEGYFTVYATFGYDRMANGMAWSWVWRHDGDVVAGGNEQWAYGETGPGYIFLQPEEGFAAGSYDLQVWVNGELLTDGSFFVTSSIAANR